MPGILDLMGYINQEGEKGRERGLASLVGKAYAAPRDQRQGILDTVAQRGAPQMAMQAQRGFEQQDDDALERFSKLSAAYASTRDPTVASQWAQAGVAAGMLPPEAAQRDFNNPADLEGSAKAAQAFAQAFEQHGAGGNVQSTYIDAQGNRVAIMRDGSTQVLGRNAPNVQLIDAGSNGYYGVNKGDLSAAPVMIGGQPQAPQMGDPQQVQQQFASLAGGFPGTQISSLQRTPEHNREVGGVPNSQHIAGTAGDFVVPPQERPQFIAQAQAQGFEAIDEGDHVHLELPPRGQGQLRRAPTVNDNGRNYVITTGPDGTIYRVDKLSGKAEPVQGAVGGGASLANLNYKKDTLAVQKGTGANQVERGLKRLEAAVNELSKNKVFDGGPLDQYALAPTKLGQEMEQAGGAIMPALTALTRVPGVGSQSDWEGRLNMMQLPSVRFSPEVNRRAIAGLRQFMTDLRAAYRKAGIPFPDDASGAAPQAHSTGGFRVLD